jgi:hypothetical protein
MQEKYIGDTPDLGKYALLRALTRDAPQLRLGVNWYLTHGAEVDRPKNNDGNKRPHVHNPKPFHRIDRELCDKLHLFQDPANRSLEILQRSGVLRGDTLFHSEPLTLTAFQGEPAKVRARAGWARRGADALEQADLVFMDPDNGFEVGTPRHHKKGPKFVFYDELTPYLERGQSVVVIQFLNRASGGEPVLAGTVTNEIRRRFGHDIDLRLPRSVKGSAALYVVLTAPQHREVLGRRLDRFIEIGGAREAQAADPVQRRLRRADRRAALWRV